jgi:DNA-3-methyladenine glycosylase II
MSRNIRGRSPRQGQQMSEIVIPVRPPYRFDLALRYFQRSPDEIVDVVRDGRHYRVFDGGDGPLLIETSPGGPESQPSLAVHILVGNDDGVDLAAALSRLYQAEVDRSSHVHAEPLALKLVQHFNGLPVVQTVSPWEALVWAIIGQQINIAFAYRLKRAFVEAFGERVASNGHVHYRFPTLERIGELEHERDLRPLQFSRQKSRYIIELARSILTGELDFDEIATLDDEAASLALQRQLGVGRWTAEYALLRGFGRRNVIPAGDAALKFAVGRHLGLGRLATEDEVRELAERWRPLRGEIAFLLWFSLQSGWFRD